MAAKKATSRKRAGKKAGRKTGKKKLAKKKASAKRAGSSRKTAARKRAATKRTKRKVSKKKSASRKKAARKKTSKKKASKKKAPSKARAKRGSKRKTASKKKASKKKVASKKKTTSKKTPAPRKKPASRKKSSAKKAGTAAVERPSARKVNVRPPAQPRHAVTPAGLPIGASLKRRSRRRGAANDNLIHGIKPYKRAAGEEYMSDGQLDHFRKILLAWKLELMEEVDRTVHHMQDEASNFPDPNDRATQESEFGLELRTRDRERKLLKKIDSALGRIDDGSYGFCEETGEEIGLKRLEARPVATLSVEAQERRELAERQYRDRDDQYR